MKVHVLRAPGERQDADLLEENFRLRHRVFVELQGWEALRRSDGRDVDAFDTDDATHILLTANDELVAGSRLTPLDKPNLLQTVFSGLVQKDLPACPALGADWTRCYVRPNRRGGRRRAPESAALFCAVMEYALSQGYGFITFVSSLAMIAHATGVGWRITPLGAPALIEGRLSVAAWVEVSQTALDNVRCVAGISGPLIGSDGAPRAKRFAEAFSTLSPMAAPKIFPTASPKAWAGPMPVVA